MPNVRVVMLSVLVLATALAMAHPPKLLQRRVLSAIDWQEVKPALTCPSDLPQDCAILWGP